MPAPGGGPLCPDGTERDLYEIVAGDFISRVADKNDISIEELEAANAENPAYQVFAPGQDLWLPCEGEDLGSVPAFRRHDRVRASDVTSRLRAWPADAEALARVRRPRVVPAPRRPAQRLRRRRDRRLSAIIIQPSSFSTIVSTTAPAAAPAGGVDRRREAPSPARRSTRSRAATSCPASPTTTASRRSRSPTSTSGKTASST